MPADKLSAKDVFPQKQQRSIKTDGSETEESLLQTLQSHLSWHLPTSISLSLADHDNHMPLLPELKQVNFMPCSKREKQQKQNTKPQLILPLRNQDSIGRTKGMG